MSTPAIQQKTNLPTVALVGRVNVGKSTLFNKLIEKDKAIVSKVPGTTRTINEGYSLWRGKEFKIIDTGGLTFTDNIPLEDEIIKQTEYAISEADVIVFVTDAKDGILPQEKELAKRLHKIKNKPIILLANKVDSNKIKVGMEWRDWSKLAFGEAFDISAANGRNVGDFLDNLYSIFNKQPIRPKQIKEQKNEIIEISIIGKPNVGKSSLFNKLIGEEKVIVSEIAHTTREPHDTLIDYKYQKLGKPINQQIRFIDTAGIRRKANVKGSLERAGIQKSIQSVEDSNLVLFVLDGSETISSQDRQLGGLLEKRSVSVIILINKWDLTEDNSDKHRHEVENMIYAHFQHLKFSPIMFVSGKTGYSVHKIFPLIMDVWKARHTEISEHDLEIFLKSAKKKKQPGRGKGTRHPDILGLRQINIAPPVFEIFIKYRTSLHRSYVNYLENKLRQEFDFLGTPVVIKLTKTKR